MSTNPQIIGSQQGVFLGRIVQGIVELGYRTRRILEGGMGGDIFHSLIVKPDFAAVIETF